MLVLLLGCADPDPSTPVGPGTDTGGAPTPTADTASPACASLSDGPLDAAFLHGPPATEYSPTARRPRCSRASATRAAWRCTRRGWDPLSLYVMDRSPGADRYCVVPVGAAEKAR